jgi:Membrane protein TerC, possibly involved in tellurium resistance
MDSLLTLAADPAAWAALLTLVVMEIVLGIDNLIFISILSNKLPEAQRARVQGAWASCLHSCCGSLCSAPSRGLRN